MKVVIPQHIKTYTIDLAERVGSTFAEAVLAGMTTAAVHAPGTLSGTPWSLILNTAGYAALYALVKGVGAGLLPVGQTQPTAGFLSAPKTPAPSAIVTKVSGAD